MVGDVTDEIGSLTDGKDRGVSLVFADGRSAVSPLDLDNLVGGEGEEPVYEGGVRASTVEQEEGGGVSWKVSNSVGIR